MTDLRGRVGARLRQLRLARRLTQAQLAERASLSDKFLGEVERGRGNPTLTSLAALSDALDVRLVDLLALDAERPRLTPRQALQVREAIASIENLVEWAVPPPSQKSKGKGQK